MPRKPKKQENGFMPLHEDSLKHAVEIPVKTPSIDDIEKIEVASKPRTKSVKSAVKKETKTAEKAKKIYTLIITEKPQAALKIASALGNTRKFAENGVPYYELEREGKKIVVACAVGHLFGLKQDKGEKGWPIYNISWSPVYENEKSLWAKKYYTLLAKLVKNAQDFIVASVDYNELTPVVEKGEAKIIKMGELVDDIIEHKKTPSDFLIPSFDSHGIIRFNKLKKAVRHKIDEDLYELSLNYGRKVKITSSHNLFTINNNKIEMVKTTDLKAGDKILCPTSLPPTIKKIKEIRLLDMIRIEKTRKIYVSGEDIAKILKQKVFSKRRKESYLNEKRVILTKSGMKVIKDRRIKLKYSTSAIAKIANISQSLVVLWETKNKNPTLKNFLRYLSCLKINKSFLNNPKYCSIKESSFDNLLRNVYKEQYRNFSDFNRAIIPLQDLNEKEIAKIKKGFIYGSKNKRNKLPIKLKVDKLLARLMGYYLAEGDINNRYRLRFSLGLTGYGHEEKIISEIKEFCSKYSISCHYYLHKKIKHQILTIDNSVLAVLFKDIFKFGNKATEKKIPNIIFNLSTNLKKEFLRAYFLGDGSISKSNITFNTASEDLALNIAYLMLQLGIVAGISKSKGKTSKSKNFMWRVDITNSRDIKKISKIWQDHHKSTVIKLTKNYTKKKGIENLGNLSLFKIKNIQIVKSSSKYVYDLSVEGENFIAGNGGVCCHNTDYDTEGEVIGLNILRFIAKQQDAKRMKFSTLTSHEIEDAYKTASSTLNWGQAIAGETRHYLDWMYGINLSRALMEAIKKAGSFRIMSIGRVQGPALHFIVQREREIMAFKPTPYWQVFIIIKGIELKYNRDITKKTEIIPLKELKIKKVDVKTEKSEQNIKPLAPFDLTTLQTEAYKFYSITPSKTLQIAQNLYLAGLISYPRTSSQKIPETISPLSIIKRLSNEYDTKLCVRKKPVEGSKSDPAHPSIYPTGELAELSGEDKEVYDLIARRFLACFCEDAIVANKTITALYKDYKFIAKGLEILKKAWMEVYKMKLQEKELPDLNGVYTIDESRIEEKMTQPPNRYSPASLVRELEKKNLGTKATRSSIVETLYNRGYIKDQSIKATSIGMSLIESLEKHSPIIIDEKLTRKFEQETDAIQTSKKDLKAKQEKILQETRETINRIAEKFKAEEAEIGNELIKANDTLRQEQRLENELVECPVCKKGKLRILYNKQSRRYFVACNAYPECKTTFSLPPNSLIKKSGKACEHCGFPLLLAIRKGKRPWQFCFNPNCESNKREEESEK